MFLSFTNITSICAEHGEIYQIFCQTHDTLLCRNCLVEHDGCKGIVPLSEIIKNVKSSTNFQETQHGLTDINKNITKIQDELKLSLEAINDEEKILMSDIGPMRKTMDDHSDKLENDLRTDSSKKATESRTAIEVSLQKLDDRKSEITKHLQQMKDLETYASDFQTYISLKEKSSAVNSTESSVQSVAKDGNLEIDTLSLNFDEKINANVSNIQLFGIVQVQKRMNHVPLIRQNVKQAQLVGLIRPLIKSINDIKLELVKTIDSKRIEIRGCEILSNGKMFFCTNTVGGRVVVFDSNGKHSFNVQMKPDIPFMDVTGIDDYSKFAITG
ncbi:unnamed protein product [Mytilus coruscus]|uniref:Uncharacterized protein n=1 Tax=Mytilus coruscus TaxID=42192 RepID=A0A6J8EQY2_MYTCO|nr:unnamed protein product [Mytilus coruscus]